MAEPVELSELKAWARVEHDDDDTLLTNLGIAAREFVEQATGKTFTEGEAPERAGVAIKALVAHWYEFREPAVIGTTAQVPMHVSRIIHQLRDWSEPADEDAA